MKLVERRLFTSKITGLILLVTMNINFAFSQHSNIPADTSYTLNSAYKKIVKSYPQIELATSKNNSKVNVDYDITYINYANRALQLDIYSPKNKSTKSNIGILLIHGGGWSTGNRTMLNAMATDLAANGFIVFNASYRLSPEALYPAAVNDLKNALAFMHNNGRKYQIDTNKIVVMGCSAGAQLASLLGTTWKSSPWPFDKDGKYQVAAIVNVDGILAFIHPESEEGKSAIKWFGGNAIEKKMLWDEASPLQYVDKNTPPSLFINSSRPRFHAGRDDMISIMNENNIYAEVHEIPDSPHSFWLFHPWYHDTVDIITKFLNDKIN